MKSISSGPGQRRGARSQRFLFLVCIGDFHRVSVLGVPATVIPRLRPRHEKTHRRAEKPRNKNGRRRREYDFDARSVFQLLTVVWTRRPVFPPSAHPDPEVRRDSRKRIRKGSSGLCISLARRELRTEKCMQVHARSTCAINLFFQ